MSALTPDPANTAHTDTARPIGIPPRLVVRNDVPPERYQHLLGTGTGEVTTGVRIGPRPSAADAREHRGARCRGTVGGIEGVEDLLQRDVVERERDVL